MTSTPPGLRTRRLVKQIERLPEVFDYLEQGQRIECCVRKSQVFEQALMHLETRAFRAAPQRPSGNTRAVTCSDEAQPAGHADI
jgi:hypothetical protein